jgi:hypothetical protein
MLRPGLPPAFNPNRAIMRSAARQMRVALGAAYTCVLTYGAMEHPIRGNPQPDSSR